MEGEAVAALATGTIATGTTCGVVTCCAISGRGFAAGNTTDAAVHSAMPWRQTRSFGRKWPNSTIFCISRSVIGPCGLPSRARYHSIGSSFSDMRVRSNFVSCWLSASDRPPGQSVRQLHLAVVAWNQREIRVPCRPELFHDGHLSPWYLISNRGDRMAFACPVHDLVPAAGPRSKEGPRT